MEISVPIFKDDGEYEYTWDSRVQKLPEWSPVDMVAKEIRPGYKLNGKVIRPAQVITKTAWRREL